MATSDYRPMTVADLASHIAGALPDEPRVRRLVLEVITEYAGAPLDARPALLDAKPAPTGDRRWDAFLAALAEHLAFHDDLSCPAWTRAPERFLDRWWFLSNGPMQAEALSVAAELNLPSTWLDQQGVFYLPRTDEPDPTPVFDHPNLRVMRASDRHLLAMKAMAARRFADMDDLACLIDRLGLRTLEEVDAVCAEVFPEEPLGERQREVIADVLAGRG